MQYENAISQRESPQTLDTFYWKNIAIACGSKKKLHFKSIGGKNTVNSIAYDIEREGIKTVSICRDADYDLLLGTHAKCSRAAYSFGYSWENDVVNDDAVRSVILRLIGPGNRNTDLIDELFVKLNEIRSDLRRWIEIDVALYASGKRCVLDRGRPLSYVDLDRPPGIKLDTLSVRLRDIGYKRRPRKVISISKEEVYRRWHGRALSKMIYHSARKLFKVACKISVDYDVFMRLLISETIEMIKVGKLPHLRSHIVGQAVVFK